MTHPDEATHQLDLLTWPIFHAMTRRGILVSFDRLQELRDDASKQLAVQLDFCREMIGDPEFNPSSSAQVASWLERERLFTGKFTAGGLPATDERSLAKFDHPIVKAILDARGLNKLIGTFIDPVWEIAKRELFRVEYGVVHPRWKLTRVRSGRIACEDPNLLAFPSRDAMGKKIRSCFVPRPGYLFLSVDFSQLEPRIVAALSQDPKLLDIYLNNKDLYTSIAADLGVSRTAAKVITLGVLYGMMAKRLYEQLILSGAVDANGLPIFDEQQCGELIEKWFATYTGVKKLVNATLAKARQQDGWARTLNGRGRFLPGLFCEGERWPASKVREEAERQAFNHLVQGSGMEMLREAMARVVDWVPQAYLLLAIHDELVLEVPEDCAPECQGMIQNAMETEIGVPVSVCLKTSASLGRDWGSLK
ncbi:MAG TPA: DNA polymerase A family protein [Polyangiaceae bacterium]